MLVATRVTAIATAGLLAGAIVTAIYAVKTFGAQSRELKLMEQQRTDQQALTRQQIELLRLQARELQRAREGRHERREVEIPTRREDVPSRERRDSSEFREPPDTWVIPSRRGLVPERRDSPPSIDRALPRRHGELPKPGSPWRGTLGTRPKPQEPAQHDTDQATQILAWQEHSQRTAGRQSRPALTVHVQNASAKPAYGIEIQWHLGSQSADEPDRIPLLLPEVEQTRWRQVPANSDVQLSATVTFRDAGGAQWARNPGTGELTPLAANDTKETGNTGAN